MSAAYGSLPTSSPTPVVPGDIIENGLTEENKGEDNTPFEEKLLGRGGVSTNCGSLPCRRR